MNSEEATSNRDIVASAVLVTSRTKKRAHNLLATAIAKGTVKQGSTCVEKVGVAQASAA